MSESLYRPSAAANAASDYFNALPREERAKLAPLLEHYRQMGFAEAFYAYRKAGESVRTRALAIRGSGESA